MKLFSETTALVVKSVAAQAIGTVVGGAVFQVGCRVGNAVYDGALNTLAAITGTERK